MAKLLLVQRQRRDGARDYIRRSAASCSWERVSASVAASAFALADGLSLQRQPLIYAEIYGYRGIKRKNDSSTQEGMN